MSLSFSFSHALSLNLKSRFIFGKRKEEEGVNEKLQKAIFFTPSRRSSVIHELSKHFVCPSLIVPVLPSSRAWTVTKAEGTVT